jgi:transcriptional/translational regulatory protein YebC/TACO1
MVLTASFENFGNMQKALESKGLTIVSAELQRIPTSLVNLNEEEKLQVEKLIERLEEDDDVQNVYSNMA